MQTTTPPPRPAKRVRTDLDRLLEHGPGAGGLGVFSRPTPGVRRKRVPLGEDHQADITALSGEPRERDDVLLDKPELFRLPPHLILLPDDDLP